MVLPRRLALAPLATLAMLALSSAGCGGFTDDIFRPGETSVTGTLIGSFDAETAWVSVVDRPDLVSGVADDGTFELENLPSGTLELIASDNTRAAARMRITLYNKRHRSVELQMTDGVRIDGQVLLSDGNVQWATVSVVGLPILPTEVTSPQGRFDLHALPPGCFALELSHPSYATATRPFCAEAGDRLDLVTILAPMATGSGASCEPCASGAECASGLCVPEESMGGVEAGTCALLCRDDLDCPGPYACRSLEGSSARICRPKEASCEAVRATMEGRSCAQQSECGESGICNQGTCTLGCQNDESCPGAGRCVTQTTEPINVCE